MNGASHLALAAAWADATRAGDVDALAALTEPDAVVWHNHDETEVDLARTNRTVAWLHRTVPTSHGRTWR